MSLSFPGFFAALLLLQGAPTAIAPAEADEMAVPSLDQIPIEQAAAPRCGVAFALVGRWQRAGEPRGSAYPDMNSEGGREFFVRSMAGLMDSQGISREAVAAMVAAEAESLATPEGEQKVAAMMPACLLMKQSAGL
ncbi:hypothetical protein [Qipengyuania sp. ASV99]|uniref:hypothetical protein n=1 Tax=Qipengyuania sp. ASV99 TaxID=3399681 RepID=UPI003A4C508B